MTAAANANAGAAGGKSALATNSADVAQLMHAQRDERYAAARRIAATDTFRRLVAGAEVNNHVHTWYSFSPYSPTAMVYEAKRAGLQAVGSVDHDSIAAASETLVAGELLAMATTVGFELRVSLAGTAVAGRKINNPDSDTLIYMVIHGVPKPSIARAAEFLAPLNAARNRRNQAQVAALNDLIRPLGIEPLHFERDVVAISKAREGGSVTERHILYALAQRVIAEHPIGEPLLRFLTTDLGVAIPIKLQTLLGDSTNPHIVYDVLGILKSAFLPRFFIQPDATECVPARTAVDFALELGAIPAYAYLGDVTESPTGDKKAEQFEDSFLDELFAVLVDVGYRSVTYMPPRNSPAQLQRVQRLCTTHGLMEISGVDINSSRQTFHCPEVLQPQFAHLNESTWALIAHEKLTARDARWSLFAADNPLAELPIGERIARYAACGRAMDPRAPWDIAEPRIGN